MTVCGKLPLPLIPLLHVLMLDINTFLEGKRAEQEKKLWREQLYPYLCGLSCQKHSIGC